jgi:roadblock/LC7 domain-containing protein
MKYIKIFSISLILSISLLILHTQAFGAVNNINKTSMPFIENIGQIADSQVSYYIETLSGPIYFTKNGSIVYKLPQKITQHGENGWVLVEKPLIKNRKYDIKGIKPSLSRVYFFKNKDFKPKTYEILNIGEMFKGIEVQFKAGNNWVEKIFHISPNADVKDINIEIKGASSLKILKSSELQITTGVGILRLSAPSAYQIINGQKKYVIASYQINGSVYGFNIGDYDKTKELIIDPELTSTFIGSPDNERLQSISIDQNGDIFVVGVTSSMQFPVTAGAYGIKEKGNQDVFITKFKKDLTTVIASSYFGGSNNDFAKASVIAEDGGIYITGYTLSSDIPISKKSYGQTHNGNYNAFVCKLSNSLANLEYSTYLSGNSNDYPIAIAINLSGDIYIAGYTSSRNFPVTKNSFNPIHSGNYDIFVSRLSSDLSTLKDSTFIGGRGRDQASSITIDADNNIYIAGATYSKDFPVTNEAFSTKLKGGSDAVAIKMSFDLRALLSATFIGGHNDDSANAIFVDGKNVYVAGTTQSRDFPVTKGTFGIALKGQSDGFIARLNDDLSKIIAGTLIGGSGKDELKSALIDGKGNIFVAGTTDSADFPVTDKAYSIKYSGNSDVFVTRIDSNLKTIKASTFIGGKYQDFFENMALYKDEYLYIAGTTNSSDFVVSANAYDKMIKGVDGFIVRLDVNLSIDGAASSKIVPYQPEIKAKSPAALSEPIKNNKPVEANGSLSHPKIKVTKISKPVVIKKPKGKSIKDSASYLEALDTVKPFTDRKIPFGLVAANNSSEQGVTLKNKGKKDIAIGPIARKNKLQAPFSIVTENCSGISLKPNETCGIKLRFQSTEKGTFTGDFDIPLQGASEKNVIINLSGIVGGQGF